MPVQVEWIRDKRAVLQTYTDPLDNTQMRALKTQMEQEIFPACTQKLHIIADFSAVKNLPGTILTTGSSMLGTAHPNTGNMICVTPSGFVQAMARIFTSLSPKHTFKIVRSLDEAYAEVDRILAQHS